MHQSRQTPVDGKSEPSGLKGVPRHRSDGDRQVSLFQGDAVENPDTAFAELLRYRNLPAAGLHAEIEQIKAGCIGQEKPSPKPELLRRNAFSLQLPFLRIADDADDLLHLRGTHLPRRSHRHRLPEMVPAAETVGARQEEALLTPEENHIEPELAARFSLRCAAAEKQLKESGFRRNVLRGHPRGDTAPVVD